MLMAPIDKTSFDEPRANGFRTSLNFQWIWPCGFSLPPMVRTPRV